MNRHTPYSRALGRAIRHARMRMGMTQPDVMKAMNYKVKQQTLSAWENGALPSLECFIDFCAAVKMPMHKVFMIADNAVNKEVTDEQR